VLVRNAPPAPRPLSARNAQYNRRMTRDFNRMDDLLAIVDDALRTLSVRHNASRPTPADSHPHTDLSADERESSAALMRVNHAGEIAAQALYTGQALTARTAKTRAVLRQAAHEERDHLAWCAERADELGGRTSLLAPLWYAGSVALGTLAGLAGDRVSLGFVAETERQVEAHLHDHLTRLPLNDHRSRAILEQMAEDEAHHGTTAILAGGTELPAPARLMMRIGGEILRKTALRV
jgi:3-demethoxyubiquinol 3-hydroxylase